MSESIAEQKNQIRKVCRQARLTLDEPFRRQASLDICEIIANWKIFQEALVILTYFPIKAEVDLRPLLAEHPQKRWVLPRIDPDSVEPSLCMHIYDPRQLVRHPFGMDEPSASSPVVLPEEIDLALVPGLAYDRHGWRLGYGGGYYDRFLSRFPGISLGICFDALILKELPINEYDVPMNWIVTEKGLANSLP